MVVAARLDDVQLVGANARKWLVIQSTGDLADRLTRTTLWGHGAINAAVGEAFNSRGRTGPLPTNLINCWCVHKQVGDGRRSYRQGSRALYDNLRSLKHDNNI